MNLLETKILVLCILAGVSFLIGLATIPLRKILGLHKNEVGRRQKIITSVLLCFGGGVLFATCMLHIMPEVGHALEPKAEEMEAEYLPHVIVCSGFFLIYLVEEVVDLMVGGHGHGHGDELQRSLSVRKYKNDGHNEESHNDMEIQDNIEAQKRKNSENSIKSIKADATKAKKTTITSGALRDFFTILALSLHAVFEGLAVGLEGHSDDVWTLFTAIACHKFVIMFCVCMELLQKGANKFIFFSYLVIFSLISSLGIGIGIIIIESSGKGADTVLVATCQGIAGGTILYVVMFEILNRERAKEVQGFVQLLAVMLGFTAMLLVEIFAHHSHDEEGEEGEEFIKKIVGGGSYGIPLGRVLIS